MCLCELVDYQFVEVALSRESITHLVLEGKRFFTQAAFAKQDITVHAISTGTHWKANECPRFQR